MKKKFATGFVILIILFYAIAPSAMAQTYTPDFTLHSTSAYLVNADSGIVMYEQDAHTPRSVASLTKLMTALLLIENTPDLASTMFYAEPTLYDALYGRNGSTADIRPGEEVTGLTLLYAMMLPSGNEAAAIAGYQLGGGSLDTFYAMMTNRAKQLGCENTNFTSAHGLDGIDSGNYSTAYDMMQIVRKCMEYDIFQTVVTSNSYDMPFTNIHTKPEFASKPETAYTIYSTVLMQRIPTAGIYRNYVRGIKTGSTLDAGRCFASSATKDGQTYYCVVLGSDYNSTDEEGYALSFTDTANLYDWVFNDFEIASVLDTTSPIAEVKVRYSSDTDMVMVYPSSDAKTLLPKIKDENTQDPVSLTFNLPPEVYAPITRGDEIGTVDVYVNGEFSQTVQLLAATDIQRNNLLFVIEKIGEFLQSTYFKVVLVLTAICIVGYMILYVWVLQTEKKRRARINAKQKGIQSNKKQMPKRRNRDE